MTPRMWFDVAMLVLVLIAGAGLVWGYKEFQAMQAKIATMESTATVTSEATDALATATDTTQTVRVVVEQKRAQSEQSFQELKQNDQNARTWADQPIPDSVRQLDGGILGYFEQVGGYGYRDRCFVFDERVALDPHLKPLRDEPIAAV